MTEEIALKIVKENPPRFVAEIIVELHEIIEELNTEGISLRNQLHEIRGTIVHEEIPKVIKMPQEYEIANEIRIKGKGPE